MRPGPHARWAPVASARAPTVRAVLVAALAGLMACDPPHAAIVDAAVADARRADAGATDAGVIDADGPVVDAGPADASPCPMVDPRAYGDCGTFLGAAFDCAPDCALFSPTREECALTCAALGGCNLSVAAALPWGTRFEPGIVCDYVEACVSSPEVPPPSVMEVMPTMSCAANDCHPDLSDGVSCAWAVPDSILTLHLWHQVCALSLLPEVYRILCYVEF